MIYISTIMQTIERESDVRIIFSDCNLTILKEYAISFLVELEKYIQQNMDSYRLNDRNALKAFVYLTINEISKRKDLSNLGIKDIKVIEL